MKMILKIDRFTASEKCFFCAYALYLIPQILNLSFYSKYIGKLPRNLIAVAIAILLIREFIYERSAYSQKNLFIAVIFGILIMIALYVGSGYGLGQKDIALMLMFVFASRRVSFKKICNVTLWISILLMVFIIFSAYAGIIDNYTILQSEGRIREFLGFRYALYPSMILYNITALIVYKTHKKPSCVIFIMLLGINYWMFTKTRSRLSFILAIAVILMSYLIKRDKLMKTKICGALCTCSFIICCVASYWLSLTYSSSIGWMRTLNSLMGGRLRLGQQSLLEYGYSLLGVRGIQWVGNGLDAYGNSAAVLEAYNYVDSFYIQVLQRYGIIVLAVLILLLSVSIYLFWKRRDYAMVLILVFLAFHGIIDDLVLRLYYNTFWFAIGIILMNKGQDFFESRRFVKRKTTSIAT